MNGHVTWQNSFIWNTNITGNMNAQWTCDMTKLLHLKHKHHQTTWMHNGHLTWQNSFIWNTNITRQHECTMDMCHDKTPSFETQTSPGNMNAQWTCVMTKLLHLKHKHHRQHECTMDMCHDKTLSWQNSFIWNKHTGQHECTMGMWHDKTPSSETQTSPGNMNAQWTPDMTKLLHLKHKHHQATWMHNGHVSWQNSFIWNTNITRQHECTMDMCHDKTPSFETQTSPGNMNAQWTCVMTKLLHLKHKHHRQHECTMDMCHDKTLSWQNSFIWNKHTGQHECTMGMWHDKTPSSETQTSPGNMNAQWTCVMTKLLHLKHKHHRQHEWACVMTKLLHLKQKHHQATWMHKGHVSWQNSFIWNKNITRQHECTMDMWHDKTPSSETQTSLGNMKAQWTYDMKKSPSDETINWAPSCDYACKKITCEC